MPPRFEGKFDIPPSHPPESLLTSALYRLPESVPPEAIDRITEDIAERVNTQLHASGEERTLTTEETTILKLKLARHYEDNGESAAIDIPTTVDALIESPRFLQNDRGSIEKLMEIHEMKTLQRIAELRKAKALETGDNGLNPYEWLFETSSGKYALARLLNMPHLEEESQYMDHCVGTSDSYINKMKRGDVEILSFRDTSTQEPLVTIEYDCKGHRLLQIKAMSDRIPTLADDFAADLIEAIEKLPETVNDAGTHRVIESKEAKHLKKLLEIKTKTDAQEPLSRDDLVFLYEINDLIQGFDTGREPLIKELRDKRNPEEDMLTIFECTKAEVAHNLSELTPETKAYVGEWNPVVYQALRQFPGITYLYESFPEKKIFTYTLETDPAIDSPEQVRQALTAKNIYLSAWADDILTKTLFSYEGKTYHLVQFTVVQLGLKVAATTQEIYEKAQSLGLELCPAEVGPHLRLAYPGNDRKFIAMEPITDQGGRPGVFDLLSDGARLGLDAYRARLDGGWDSDDQFVFLSRQV